MEHAVAATSPTHESATIPVPVVSLGELWPWALFAVVLLVQIYFVAALPNSGVHEFLHDGRHLLGFPCH
jgi:cobalt transporter subunit CbtB